MPDLLFSPLTLTCTRTSAAWPSFSARALISSARRSVSIEWISLDQGEDLADLVALEVADHVPADGTEGVVAGGGAALHLFVDEAGPFDELLDAVFAEVELAEVEQVLDDLEVNALGDGDQADLVGPATRARIGGLGDLLADALEVVGEAAPLIGCTGYAAAHAGIIPAVGTGYRVPGIGRSSAFLRGGILTLLVGSFGQMEGLEAAWPWLFCCSCRTFCSACLRMPRQWAIKLIASS